MMGTSHLKSGKPCQDASVCELLTCSDSRPVLVAVVSDGAGSAKYSDLGSALACSLFVDAMKGFVHEGNEINQLNRAFFEAWLTRFQGKIKQRAADMALVPRDFACTLVAAVISEDCAVFVQIGDGAIVIESPEEPDTYSWVFWPQQGEYENTTYFATDSHASQFLQFDIFQHHGCKEVALFSDGLQRLALHYQSQSAFSPFFRPFFQVLRAQEEVVSEQYMNSLAAFLDSKVVNERTDDDKTLILATRRTIPSINAEL
ncbi:hypothetical protein D3C73_649400 [compost metagenome]